ncbi:putative alpha beta-hydrolase protein [Zalerion maritima]|uniref:Alpha beta-hydrolase protein n=1 Tax=Zalerion maritima TaxID=339359 RepID=A0AAD5RMM0_9PEZI|nr:putative alpha beta-hydrolase protein [Zalerion maritima]
MDQLPAFGTPIFTHIHPTLNAYKPLLLARSSAIRSTPKETHRYSQNHPRQELDIYFPACPSVSPSSGRRRVLLFLYGGGLAVGSRTRLPYADGLTYANLAHYFATRHSLTVVIPDYRLVGDHGARFPSGGEDLMLAISWLRTELAGRPGFGGGIDLAIMGNSAGGIHTCTYLFSHDARFAESRASIIVGGGDGGGGGGGGNASSSPVALKAVVLLAVPYQFQSAIEGRRQTLETYFGGPGGVEENCPLSLLRKAVDAGGGKIGMKGVKFMQMDGPLDPDDEILEPGRMFKAAWPEDEVELTREIADGHNHISPPLGLGTGIEKEESWGEIVGKFVDAACT